MARARVLEVNAAEIVTPEGWSYARNARRSRANPEDLVDTRLEAKKIRERFYGKPSRNETELAISWPRFVRYLGITNAEQYMSDKKLAHWKMELFKHIAEDEQYLFVNDEITTLLNDDGKPVEFRETGRKMKAPKSDKSPSVFYTSSYEISGLMPKHFAILAEDKGVQWVTPDGRYWEARIPGLTLAAAPVAGDRGRGGKAFLFGYSDEGVHYIITGKKLNVTEDGIVH